MRDATQRFSDRVSDYIKYRPGYPTEVINYLEEYCGLTTNSIIADVGSGTGIFSTLLLDKGYTVYAVEPNESMRHAAEEILKGYQDLISINGTAENTGITSNSIDLVVCAQSFHWFDRERAKVEFHRILKNGSKYVALIWNNRLTMADEFAIAYDRLLEDRSTDYKDVNHQQLKDADLAQFFKDGKYDLVKFPNQQTFNYDGLAGRAFSSSYVPPQNTPEGIEFAQALKVLFDKYNVNNSVVFKYHTEIYLGEV